MATIAIQPARYVRGRDGAHIESEEMTFSNTPTTLIAGDFCVKVDNVVVAIADAATSASHFCPAAASEVMPGKTLKMPFGKLKPGDIFEVNAYHSTAASAVIADSLLDVSIGYGLKKVSGCWTLDLETATDMFLIVDRIDTATDIYPRCRVEFVRANLLEQ